MNAADDLAYLMHSPSDVHCNYCDALNLNVDITDDIRTGDWAYIFECRTCTRINDEHGNSLDRGAVTPAASFWMFAAAAAGIVLFLYQPFIFWTAVGVFAYAAVLLAIICVFAGAKKEENHHE